MKRRLLLATGWAHPPGALGELAQAAGEAWQVELCAPSQLAAALAEAREPLHLGGWSLGALMALDAALTAPGLVRGLFLIAGMASFCRSGSHPSGFDSAVLRVMRRTLRADPRTTLADFMARCAAPHEPLADDERARPALGALTAGLETLQRLDLSRRDLRAAPPMVLLHGAADAIVPPASSLWLAERVPSARRFERAGAGHDLPRRFPAWCALRLQDLEELCP